MEDDTRTPTGRHQVSLDTRPDPNPVALGVLGLVFGVLSAILALTVYLTLFAFLGAVIALVLGMLALGDERSHRLGVGAIVVATVATICATAVLVSWG